MIVSPPYEHEDWALWDNLPAAVDAVMDAVEPSVIGAAPARVRTPKVFMMRVCVI